MGSDEGRGNVRIKDKTVRKTLAQCSFAQGGEIASLVFASITADSDVNLGDIALAADPAA